MPDLSRRKFDRHFSRRALLTSMAVGGVAGSMSGNPPNIVLIVADMLGYNDTGPYGAQDVRTPNLNRLAAQGIRFTNAYASAPVCTPSRAGPLTGRYQQRFGVESNIGDDGVEGLPASALTIAQSLKKADYATAVIGKWHLGFGPEFGPGAHGFDYSLCFNEALIDYFSHRGGSGHPALYENGRAVEIGGYTTDLFTNRAVSFIAEATRGPFFLYLAYNAALPPCQPPTRPGDIRVKGPDPSNIMAMHRFTRQDYVATIEAMDAGIGRILAAVERAGAFSNTFLGIPGFQWAGERGLAPPTSDLSLSCHPMFYLSGT